VKPKVTISSAQRSVATGSHTFFNGLHTGLEFIAIPASASRPLKNVWFPVATKSPEIIHSFYCNNYIIRMNTFKLLR